MPTLDARRGKGKGEFKRAVGTQSLAPGESIDTGFNSVDGAQLTAEDSSGTVVANVDSTSDGTVTVQHNASGGGSVTVHYDILGQ